MVSVKTEMQDQNQFHMSEINKSSTAAKESKQFPDSLGSDYDPYASRQVAHPTKNWETFLHLLKAALGTGILAMPNAFHNSGWALGLGGIVLIATICTYCVHLLIKCQYEVSKRNRSPLMDYPTTAKAAMMEGPYFFTLIAPAFGCLVNFFLLCYQIGTCCVYVVFIASNLKDVVEDYMKPIDIRLYMAMILLPLLLINYVRNLKYLVPFSMLANFVTLISFAITFSYVFKDKLPNLSERDAIGNVRNWPLFFGTVLFSLEAIGVIIPLENEMKTPQSFGGYFGVLNWAMLTLVTLYSIFGFFGYLKYGGETKGSITLNIPQDEALSQSVKILISCAVCVSYALQCYVAIDIVWREYLEKKCASSPRKIFWEYLVRTAIVLFTFILAAVIPNLELFISLVGAFCVSLLAIFFPALMDTSVHWHQRTGYKFYLICMQNFSICCFGAIALFTGCSVALAEIIDKVFR